MNEQNMEQAAEEQLQTNVYEAHKYDFMNNDWENTPFRIVGDEEKGYIASIGNYRITDFMSSPDDVKLWVTSYPWIVTERLIHAICDFREKNAELIKKMQ